MDHSHSAQVTVTATQCVKIVTPGCTADNTATIRSIQSELSTSPTTPGSIATNSGSVTKSRMGGETTLNIYPWVSNGGDGSNGSGDQGKLYVALWYPVGFECDAKSQTTLTRQEQNAIQQMNGEGQVVPGTTRRHLCVIHEYNITANASAYGSRFDNINGESSPYLCSDGGSMCDCTISEVLPPPASSGEIFSSPTRGSGVIRLDLHGCSYYSIIPSCVDESGGSTNNCGTCGFAYGCE